MREPARRPGDFAVAGAAVRIRLDDGDRVGRCAIGLFGVGPALVSVAAQYLFAALSGFQTLG